MKFGFIKAWRHIWTVEIVANVLDGDFTADAQGQKWTDDISYVWTAQGWLYLAVVLDLHSRRIVGWPFDFAQESAIA